MLVITPDQLHGIFTLWWSNCDFLYIARCHKAHSKAPAILICLILQSLSIDCTVYGVSCNASVVSRDALGIIERQKQKEQNDRSKFE